jgi:phage replication-related protein YjqB (UPF0714/DUF867 family)
LAEEMPHEGRAERWPDASWHAEAKASERSRDAYSSFAELSRHEKEGIDFRVLLKPGNSGIAVAAPHGGGIEPGTTEIGEAIAADDHAFYTFEGLKLNGNGKLHLTSTHFDEPVGLGAIKRARSVLTIHGCGDDRPVVYVGGLDLELKKRMSKAFELAGFTVEEHAGLMGSDPQNLCNRGTGGGGVQLELSAGLRRLMFVGLSRQGRKTTTAYFEKFVTAVRQAIAVE